MSREVNMPQLGFTMVEGTVAQWLKAEGEGVARGEPLMEITSEKATVEVESPVAGVVERILVPVGGTVPVGAPVCLVAAEGEAAVANAEGPRMRASGLAKRMARERGIDLAGLHGSGPGGRVLESDVVAFLAAGSRGTVGKGLVPFRTDEGGQVGPEDALTRPPAGLSRGERRPRHPLPAGEGRGEGVPARARGPALHHAAGGRVPFAGVRRLTAERMFQSVQSTAQLTLVAEVDATEAVRLREQLLPEWERTDGVRLSFNDLIVKACAKALGEHPYMNASLAGDEIVLHPEVNVGIAVALEDGLVVPVIRNAANRQLREIALEAKGLADRARRKALSPDDMRGGTFTVTNLGSYGIEFFTPIINPPEAAILGVGRVAERPAVYNGEVCKRSLMYLSLTFDHRLVDGAPAARFLGRIREMLERPYLLLT